MRITDAQLTLSGSHTQQDDLRVQDSLRVWTRPAPTPAAPEADRVTLSPDGLDAAADVADEPLDPELEMLKTLLEYIFGIKIAASALRGGRTRGATADGDARPARRSVSPAPAQQLGFEYKHQVVRESHEATSFSAIGVVHTADGQQVTIDLSMELHRDRVEVEQRVLRGGAPEAADPLVLNYGGTAATLTDARFSFDLDADGRAESLPTLAAGSGFLALDTNGDGRVSGGGELFGPATGQGFAELAAQDADGNGWIDEADPVYSRLRVWSPSADTAGTLATLSSLRIGAIAVQPGSTPFTQQGASGATLGVTRATSVYLREDGGVGTVQQVDLVAEDDRSK